MFQAKAYQSLKMSSLVEFLQSVLNVGFQVGESDSFLVLTAVTLLDKIDANFLFFKGRVFHVLWWGLREFPLFFTFCMGEMLEFLSSGGSGRKRAAKVVAKAGS